MVAAKALKLWRQVYLQWHDVPTEFNMNLPIDSVVDGRTDTQTGW